MNKFTLAITVLLLGAGSAAAGAINVLPVPETGTTLGLLGLGLTAVVAVRHRFASKK